MSYSDSKMKQKNRIHRQSLLYKTDVEYGDYTINHVLGCSHGCTFPCYAFNLARRFGRVKDYNDWLKPRLVENAIELLKKELPKKQKNIRSVHLCFTTDPFMMGHPEVTEMSLELIKILDQYGIKCTALTKGILPSELASFGDIHTWGITLVSLDEGFRKQYEPFSADYQARLASLKRLHDLGCNTWVSIEPYPTPNIVDQDLPDLLEKIYYVDGIVFGRLHYNKLVAAYKDYQVFYNNAAQTVIDFCDEQGIDCHIKEKTLVDNEHISEVVIRNKLKPKPHFL